MSALCLRSSKIQKVMRLISELPDEKVPRDGQFRFRVRARMLVDKWQVMLDDAGEVND